MSGAAKKEMFTSALYVTMGKSSGTECSLLLVPIDTFAMFFLFVLKWCVFSIQPLDVAEIQTVCLSPRRRERDGKRRRLLTWVRLLGIREKGIVKRVGTSLYVHGK